MSVVRRATTLVVLFGVILCAQAQSWQNLFPAYSGLASDGEKFVAVSTDGAVKVFNKNAEEQHQHFIPNAIQSAAFGDNKFLISYNLPDGRGGSIYSSNGINWIRIFSEVSNASRKLIFGANGTFLGVADGATFVFWDDEWEDHTFANNKFADVAYGGAAGSPRYVAVGNVITSSATPGVGIHGWANHETNKDLSLVAFGSGKFVAYGSGNSAVIWTSTNGTSWNQESPTGISAGMTDMIYANDKFMAVGANGAAAFSTDGISWTAVQTGSNDDFKAVQYGDGVFMALGVNGSVYTSANGGTSWEAKIDGNSISYSSIAFGGGHYMAVGDNGAVVSSNGKTWTKKTAANLEKLNSVAHGNNRFVTVNETGRIFVTGDNGDNWEETYDPNNPDSLTGVAYGGGKFVAVGKTTGTFPAVIRTSTNGDSWGRQIGQNTSIGWGVPGSVFPTSVCFGNNKFWAGSTASGMIFESNDGEQWNGEMISAISGYRVTSIAFANGKLTGALGTIAGPSNKVFSSDNGTTWSVFDAPSPVRSVTYSNGYYIAVADSGKIFTSTNGQTWNQRASTTKNLRTVFSNTDIVLAAGVSGAMVFSETKSLSVRHQSSASHVTQNSVKMSVDTKRSIPRLTLSFSAPQNAKITFYSLNGKTLYTLRLKAGERSVELPKRVTQNGVVIAQYTSGNQKFAQRFQFTK